VVVHYIKVNQIRDTFDFAISSLNLPRSLFSTLGEINMREH